MKQRRASVPAGLIVLVFVWSILCPRDLWAIDEDDLKTVGIVTGITLGVGLAIVLIAGTLTDFGGDDEEEGFLSYSPEREPTAPASFVAMLLGKGCRVEDWFSRTQRPGLPALPKGALPRTESLNALLFRTGQPGRTWLEDAKLSDYSETVPGVRPQSR